MAQKGRVRNKWDLLISCNSREEFYFLLGKTTAARRAFRRRKGKA